MVLKSGEHKDIGSPFREMTPEEKKIMQEVLDNVHQQFIQAVAEGRKMDRAKVVEIADGRILTGEQAKNLGLVDQTGKPSGYDRDHCQDGRNLRESRTFSILKRDFPFGSF